MPATLVRARELVVCSHSLADLASRSSLEKGTLEKSGELRQGPVGPGQGSSSTGATAPCRTRSYDVDHETTWESTPTKDGGTTTQRYKKTGLVLGRRPRLLHGSITASSEMATDTKSASSDKPPWSTQSDNQLGEEVRDIKEFVATIRKAEAKLRRQCELKEQWQRIQQELRKNFIAQKAEYAEDM